MNDTTTPTAQPDELSAIRARVDEIEHAANGYYEKHLFLYSYGWKWNGDHWKHPNFVPVETTEEAFNDTWIRLSRRLLELLDERDAQLLATERTCRAYAATSEERFDEIESLRRELAEAREKAIEDAAGYVLRIDMSKVLAGQIANGIRSLKPQSTK